MHLWQIYSKGTSDARYGYTYLDPYWTREELLEWERGYRDELIRQGKYPEQEQEVSNE